MDNRKKEFTADWLEQIEVDKAIQNVFKFSPMLSN